MTRDDVAVEVKALVVSVGEHPWDINNGTCAEFAVDLIERLKEQGVEAQERNSAEELAGHTWVYVPSLKLHFDAEEPYGVGCFLELPVFLRYLSVRSEHPGPWTAGELEFLGETKSAEKILLAGRARWWEKDLKGRFDLLEDLNLSCGGRAVPAGRYKALYVVASSGRVVIEGAAGSFNIPSHDLAWALEIGTAKKLRRKP